ncbi:MAG TPA: dolichyl-phosphate beta-glucosyltransferase [Candidatus Acidoferrales bacterium]|nr:dolichyl-phosphate beta-glucosyltransferase [Candidatus Acidoferrales bacterium]
MSPPPELSVIIPAYNEEERLPQSLERVSQYLRSLPFASEIIVVDDGSKDRTAQVVTSLARSTIPNLFLVSNDRNRGKGFSVRHGMLEARGRIALFTDADLSAPIEESEKLLAALESADVAIGSRALDRRLIEIHQSVWREFAGILFNKVMRLLTGLPFEDTQCGFKVFAMPESRIIFEKQSIEDFGFDPEILFLARRHGLRIAEVPVRWSHDPRTKVHVVRDSVKMLLDLLWILWNDLLGRYSRRSR